MQNVTLQTGIPVYHVVIDYVLEGDDVDSEPIQVRKVFCTKKLLEEGFANVEVLVLYDDPTTAILMEDYVRQKKEHEERLMRTGKDVPCEVSVEKEDDDGVPALIITVLMFSIASILISASLVGAVLIILRLPSNRKVLGWVSLAVGVLFLYPTSQLVYSMICYLYRLAGQLSDRPGVIIHGHKNNYQCHATLDPRELFEMANLNRFCRTGNATKSDGDDGVNLDVSALQLPSVDEGSSCYGRDMGGERQNDTNKNTATPRNLLYPNAGCGFGEYQIHMPRMGSNCSGGRPSGSSVSSLSASGNSNRLDRARSFLNLPSFVKWEAKPADVETA